MFNDLDPNDRCAYGHQLAPGSSPVRVGTLPNGKPELRLLRNHAATEPSEFRPHGHFNDGKWRDDCVVCTPPKP